MPLKDTVVVMSQLLKDLAKDLEKSGLGNKSAAQRVRVNSVIFEKISKVYRKESLASEKKPQCRAAKKIKE